MLNLSDKKIAIFGGTFNPIHIGHLLTGYDVIENLNYDYIIYIPDNIPAHKELDCEICSKDRLQMVKLAVKNHKKFLYSDIEIKKGGISYSIDTVREIKKKYNISNKIGLIIGSDLVESLNTWKEIDNLVEECDIICLKRDSSKNNFLKYRLTNVKNRIIDISSTLIRERIKNKLPIDFMVTEKVKKFISKKKLYK